MPRVLEWMGRVQPDVLCLQETKLTDASFPHEGFQELGYASAAHGDGRYNGVAILSRLGLERVSRGFAGEPGSPEVQRRAIAADCGELRVWSVYVPNGRSLESPQLQYKLAWLDALRAAVGQEVAAGHPVVLCGDFNVAPTDDDVWDPAEFVGSTHVSPAEREALDRLVELGLTDVRPRATQGSAVHLLGLPRRDVPPRLRDAHRPRARERPARPGHQRRLHRSRRTQGSQALRPRPGRR